MTVNGREAGQVPADLLRDMIHRMAGAVVAVTFAGYGLALYLWLEDLPLIALLVATLAFLLFRVFRPLALQLARWRLARCSGCAEALAELEQYLDGRSSRELFARLEGTGARSAPSEGADGQDQPGDDQGRAAERRDRAEP